MICAFTESKTTVRDDDDDEGRGDEEREGAVDHIKPFRDYYLQAETSTEALVNIRLVLYHGSVLDVHIVVRDLSEEQCFESVPASYLMYSQACIC